MSRTFNRITATAAAIAASSALLVACGDSCLLYTSDAADD